MQIKYWIIALDKKRGHEIRQKMSAIKKMIKKKLHKKLDKKNQRPLRYYTYLDSEIPQCRLVYLVLMRKQPFHFETSMFRQRVCLLGSKHMVLIK